MSVIITLFFILFSIFLLSFYFHSRVLLKNYALKNKFNSEYTKFYSIIGIISLYLIPIMNSSLFQDIFPENFSIFRQLSIWFLILGIIFVVLGIKLYSLARKTLHVFDPHKQENNLIKSGIFMVMRFPSYSIMIIVFIGLAFIFDSYLSLILCPFLFIILVVKCNFEEKKLYLPKFGIEYEKYVKKVPNRLFPPPYNYVMMILTFIILYIGFLNIF